MKNLPNRCALGALALAVVTSACSSTSASIAQPEFSAFDMAVQADQAFSMVVMRRGAAADFVSNEDLKTTTRAHMEFSMELMSEGMLLLSGPATPPRLDRSLRSIGFFNTANARDAYILACSDPACEAGLLTCEIVPFITKDNLRALPAMERGMKFERGSNDIAARPYVLAQVPTSSAVDAMVDRMGAMALFSGQCVGGAFEGMTLIAMDCRTVGEARTIMSAFGESAAGFEFHPWVSTQALTNIR